MNRNKIIADKIIATLNEVKERVLVIIGKGHLKGVLRYLSKGFMERGELWRKTEVLYLLPKGSRTLLVLQLIKSVLRWTLVYLLFVLLIRLPVASLFF